MGQSKRRDLSGTHAEEDSETALITTGKELLKIQKITKDTTLKLLKNALKILEDASQDAPTLRLASSDVGKAVVKPEFLKHKDKEVRLYATSCILHILRLNAPDSPFTDPQMEVFFRQLVLVLRELHDPGSAHFVMRRALLEVAARVKCCLLLLDLDGADSLLLDLFNAMFETANPDNAELIEEPALLLLASLVDEGDEPSQPLLDLILGRLLPLSAAESPTAYRLALQLLRRCQSTLQPSVQKFLTRLLEGQRTDSELAGSCSDLILAVHRAAPQITLPVLPHLAPSLVVEAEERRLDAVDLISRLLTAPGGQTLLTDYPTLPEALMGRMNDRCASVRLQVLNHAQSLADAYPTDDLRQTITSAVTLRLQDPEEKVRANAAHALCAIFADHPLTATKDDFLSLVGRLRDKRLAVRKEVATHMATVVRSWSVRWEDPSAAPVTHRRMAAQLVLGLFSVALAADADLAIHVLDDVFRNGIFSSKLPVPATAKWLATMWALGPRQNRASLITLLQSKCDIQRQVQDLLRLREEAKEREVVQGPLLGQSKSPIPGTTDDNGTPAAHAPSHEEVVTPGTAKAQLEGRLVVLAGSLGDGHRMGEGLQRLWQFKDNHIFKGLATLAAYGTTMSAATAAAKDVLARVGSRGPAGEATSVLVARLSPNLVSPEVLSAALSAEILEEAGDRTDDVIAFALDIAEAAPHLLAGLLSTLSSMLEADDQMVSEVAAKALAAGGMYIATHAKLTGEEIPQSVGNELRELCLMATPSGAEAAVRALVHLYGREAAEPAMRDICQQGLTALRSEETLQVHSRIMASLNALSTCTRVAPQLLVDFGEELYDWVMNDMLAKDLSGGRPLALPVANTPTTLSSATSWGHPSPDIEIKAAAMRKLAEALVPDDPGDRPPETAMRVTQVLIPQLVDLTDVDTDAPAFSNLRWQLASVTWRNGPQGKQAHGGLGTKRKATECDDEDDGALDWDAYDEEERAELEKRTKDASPDAGWVRLAAGVALCRLVRAYDSSITGSDYMALALVCQDPLGEVRMAFLDEIRSGVEHFQGPKAVRINPQRAAKLAALYVLYAADPAEAHVREAYRRLREYVWERRALTDRAALSSAAAGGSGSHINEMPELILPYLVYLMAHHPDYDSTELYDDEVTSAGPDAETDEPAVVQFFRKALQMALEVLIIPCAGLGSGPDAAAETATTAALTFKVFRSIKYCNALDLEATPRGGAPDPEATACSHQLSDIAIFLARELLRVVMAGSPRPLLKFPGGVALPKLCFHMRSGVQKEDKRRDGSDLPRRFRPALEPLFTALYSPAGGADGKSPGGGVQKRARARSKPKGEAAVQKPAKQRPAAKSQRAERGVRAPSPLSDSLEHRPGRAMAPARQQPRRTAKDAAGDKIQGRGEGDSDSMDWEDSSRSDAAERSGDQRVFEGSPEQENANKLNVGAHHGAKKNPAAAIPQDARRKRARA